MQVDCKNSVPLAFKTYAWTAGPTIIQFPDSDSESESPEVFAAIVSHQVVLRPDPVSISSDLSVDSWPNAKQIKANYVQRLLAA